MLPHGRSSLYAGASGSSPRKRAGVFPAHETSWRFRVTPVSGSTVDLSIDVHSMPSPNPIGQVLPTGSLTGTLPQALGQGKEPRGARVTTTPQPNRRSLFAKRNTVRPRTNELVQLHKDKCTT